MGNSCVKQRYPASCTEIVFFLFMGGWENKGRGILERVKGIEPSYRAWEALVLPLNYTRFEVRKAL